MQVADLDLPAAMSPAKTLVDNMAIVERLATKHAFEIRFIIGP
ncbi:hypothetical protein GMES_2487 [Paraglaciecola mesophila KMM 241]|uniref:Uncharacterized protein n=1 Tax=Paraglaciecola mesophila KMM 241 TaxID=1128912 RepID=K6Z337_9ALTE|nr:hypothetical protein GMES_2487 [Paraglaciecola mesophila KMM 241]